MEIIRCGTNVRPSVDEDFFCCQPGANYSDMGHPHGSFAPSMRALRPLNGVLQRWNGSADDWMILTCKANAYLDQSG